MLNIKFTSAVATPKGSKKKKKKSRRRRRRLHLRKEYFAINMMIFLVKFYGKLNHNVKIKPPFSRPL